jgi:hypothetical protein
MALQIVKYQLDDSTVVGFEVAPGSGWQQAGAKEFVGKVRESVTPAIEAAKAVLEQAKEIAPDSIEVKFGVKVTGEANWIVAKAASEGSFEITLRFEPGPAERIPEQAPSALQDLTPKD